jgi:hypothetical protein
VFLLDLADRVRRERADARLAAIERAGKRRKRRRIAEDAQSARRPPGSLGVGIGERGGERRRRARDGVSRECIHGGAANIGRRAPGQIPGGRRGRLGPEARERVEKAGPGVSADRRDQNRVAPGGAQRRERAARRAPDCPVGIGQGGRRHGSSIREAADLEPQHGFLPDGGIGIPREPRERRQSARIADRTGGVRGARPDAGVGMGGGRLDRRGVESAFVLPHEHRRAGSERGREGGRHGGRMDRPSGRHGRTRASTRRRRRPAARSGNRFTDPGSQSPSIAGARARIFSRAAPTS